LLIGEMVGKVVSNAPCSVLIVPQRATMWTRRVLLGVEPDPPLDDATLGRAAGIAVDCALPLTLVAVAATEAQRSIAQAALDAAAPKARAIGAAVDTELRVGHAATELIAATAARRADLLVVGRRHAAAGAAPRGGIGATAHKVIGEADCAVLVHAT
jgi:nucleotide-binding universal stress UspA family protein